MSAQWEAVVAAEDACLYAYGAAGARLSGPDRRRAERGRAAHLSARAAAATIASSTSEPAPAYDLGGPVDSPAQARALLARVEMSLSAVYAEAAGASEGSERRSAARAAAECAMRAVDWGAVPQAFPA